MATSTRIRADANSLPRTIVDGLIVERRHVRLHKVGGSRRIVVPKEWLDRHGIGDEADLVLTLEDIRIEPSVKHPPTLEDEPQFAAFLQLLLQDVLTNPQQLVDATERLAADAAWLRDLGVE
jgi:bifunctional DNA-binding transcriptional regulator/antitoxin component of YhaV-PrlF toxin-antitoxin module